MSSIFYFFLLAPNNPLWADDQQTEEQLFARYQNLSQAEKDKDRQLFNRMLKLLKKFDGLRIYQY